MQIEVRVRICVEENTNEYEVRKEILRRLASEDRRTPILDAYKIKVVSRDGESSWSRLRRPS